MRNRIKRLVVFLLATTGGVVLLALAAVGWVSVTTISQATVLTAITGIVLLALATVGWSLMVVSAPVVMQPAPESDESFKLALDTGTHTRFSASREDPLVEPSGLPSWRKVDANDQDLTVTQDYPNGRSYARVRASDSTGVRRCS